MRIFRAAGRQASPGVSVADAGVVTEGIDVPFLGTGITEAVE